MELGVLFDALLSAAQLRRLPPQDVLERAISSSVAFAAARAARAGSIIRRTSSSSATSPRFCASTLASGTTSASVDRSRTTVPLAVARLEDAHHLQRAHRVAEELRPTPSFAASSRSGGRRSPRLERPARDQLADLLRHLLVAPLLPDGVELGLGRRPLQLAGGVRHSVSR